MVSLEKIHDDGRRIDWRNGDAGVWPSMTEVRDVVMTHYIRDAVARIRHMTVTLVGRRIHIRRRVRAAVALSPPRKPVRDRGQRAAVPGATTVFDGLVGKAVELEHGKRRSGRVAVAEIGVGVERAGHRSERGKGGTVVRRACQSVGEAAAVGHAVGVYSCGVDAVIAFEVGYEIAGEKLVLNARRRVEFAFPGSLAALGSGSVTLDGYFLE